MMNEGQGAIAQDWHAFTACRIVANEFSVAESALLNATRSKADIAQARQVAMYLAHVVYQLSYNQIAAAFRRERSTIAHACAIVEDLRDDLEFDERLDKLEDRLKRLDDIRHGRHLERKGFPTPADFVVTRSIT